MTAFGDPVPLDEEFDPHVGIVMRRGVAPRHRSHAEIVKSALTLLRSLGYARKVHGGAMGNTGEPDLDACIHGRTLKLEAKTIGDYPTGPQNAALRRWAMAGALVGWFRTDEEIRQILDHLTEVGFVPDLSRPGCSCARHAGGAKQ
jgi:hypothetical protein